MTESQIKQEFINILRNTADDVKTSKLNFGVYYTPRVKFLVGELMVTLVKNFTKRAERNKLIRKAKPYWQANPVG